MDYARDIHKSSDIDAMLAELKSNGFPAPARPRAYLNEIDSPTPLKKPGIKMTIFKGGDKTYSLIDMSYDDVMSLKALIDGAKLPEKRRWNRIKEIIENNIEENETY